MHILDDVCYCSEKDFYYFIKVDIILCLSIWAKNFLQTFQLFQLIAKKSNWVRSLPNHCVDDDDGVN